jgi:aerobic-type carbon monoxide dehydrogenase small subunit (CoxS/CutS family)
MNIRIEFFLNGEPVLRDCDAADSLMDILRKDLGQKYLREGCRRGHCGACTVLMDDYPGGQLPGAGVQPAGNPG